MSYQIIDGVPVWGDPDYDALRQLQTCLRHPRALRGALMADHHVGYAMPIGGVIAYENAISPSGVGYDIGCGNKAVRLEGDLIAQRDIFPWIVDGTANDIASTIAFGIGRTNSREVPRQWAEIEGHDAWNIPFVSDLKGLARSQLGTVGSGNHYVDVFADEHNRTWVGVHFGSRGLGHKIASHYIKAGGGKDGMFVDPVVLDMDSELGKEYALAMDLAGRYAYVGRDWVCEIVAKLIGGRIVQEVHNHHNFAWSEEDNVWTIRKGATPAYSGQRGFVGATMAEPSVILEGYGREQPFTENEAALWSTVHGAGRVLSRKKAKQEIDPVDVVMMLRDARVVLRGGGLDEAPQAYKRLDDVLEAHSDTVRVTHTLRPLIVCMAGADIRDPYKG